MPLSLEEMQAIAAEEIDPAEDDIGPDLDEDDAFSSGAKDASGTWGGTATTVASTGDVVASTALSIVSHSARIAAVAQTGSVAAAIPAMVGGSAGTVALTGVAGGLAAASAVTGPIGIALALVESGFSAYSAVKTYKHIKALERILLSHGHLAKPGTQEAIIFACKKKNKKLKRKGIGCVPILGSICNSTYTLGRTIYKRAKGTRGLERRQQASMLWQNTLLDDHCAIAACKELLGDKIYGMIEGLADGHLVLKKKLKSL